MSLMGIDVGTTGCKAAVFSTSGGCLAVSYREYDVQRPLPGHAELDTAHVWTLIREVIREAAAAVDADPVSALCVSSLGEAFVPVTRDRRILGPSLLNFDERGAEYLEGLGTARDNEALYAINGNTWGNHYSLPKILWLRDHQPEVYEAADQVLLWAGFASFMLGAEAVTDYTLANRTLLFDVDRVAWSDDLVQAAGIDPAKLPATVPSGTVIGTVSDAMADSLGLARGVAIVSGAHDQCANAVGCGAVVEGRAMFGMGTYICIVPVFSERQPASTMIAHGFNTEHHAAPGKYVCFIYNHGGSLLKWYRDTFAAAERDAAKAAGTGIYPPLIAEMPSGPSRVLVLPHFAPTGPPEFVSDSSGVMLGLRLETPRGEILKGILEGAVFYLRECVAPLSETSIRIDEFRAVGGGSHSDAWLRISADILGRPLMRVDAPEAGALGGAILAGTATGVFGSIDEGVEAMVRAGDTFEPDPGRQAAYDARFERYRELWPLMGDYLRRV